MTCGCPGVLLHFSVCHGGVKCPERPSLMAGSWFWGCVDGDRRAESAEQSVTSAEGLRSRGAEQGWRGQDVVPHAGTWWWSCGLLVGRFLGALSTGMSWACGSEPLWPVLCACLGASRAPGWLVST